MEYLKSYVISPIQTLLDSPPDIYSILILLLVLFLSLKILDYARRVITFWVVLIFRLVFWGSILSGAFYAYSVGWEKSFRDAAWILGLLEGFVRQILADRGSSSDGKSGASGYGMGRGR